MTFMFMSLLTIAAGAGSELDADVNAALRLLADDPPIADIQKAALDHFGVATADLTTYRVTARLRALVPSVNGGVSQNDSKSRRMSTDLGQVSFPWDPANPQIHDNTDGTGRNYNAGLSWDLKGLVFDNAQLEAYALVGINEDVVKEVTRLYYARQHNVLALALDPPKDPRGRAALILRTREIEAMLDAMTGGVWTSLKKGGR